MKELTELIEKQLKHVTVIQYRIERLSSDCPTDELMNLTQALNCSVATLSTFMAMLPPYSV